MTLTITCTKIVKKANGTIYVRFSTGDEREFPSLQAMQDFLDSMLNRHVLYAIMMRVMLERQPAFGTPSVFENHGITVDTDSANLMVIT